MALFGSFGKIFTRGVAAFATGGASEIVRAVSPSGGRLLEQAFAPGIQKPQTPLELLVGIPGTVLAGKGLTALGTTAKLIAGTGTVLRQTVGSTTMGLDFARLATGLGTVLAGAPVDPRLKFAGGLAQAIGGAFAPQPAAFPVGTPGIPQAMTVAGGRVMAPGSTAGMVLGGAAISAARIIRRVVAPILAKISATMGRPISLRQAVKMVRSAGRFLEPAAIAAALGIAVSELAQLILADAQLPRRRMNPANSSALRRAARRIESFHRLCVRTDRLRSPGRRRASKRGSACPPGVQVVRSG